MVRRSVFTRRKDSAFAAMHAPSFSLKLSRLMCMSGIVGIFNRDERPVERALFAQTLDSLVHRGSDGNAQWIKQNVALGHQMMWTTPEAHHETQPLLDQTGQLCLVMDGRVDNRAEVKKALASNGYELRTDTDAEIVLCAYECWGESFPARIVGDFAIAIWDARKRQLFCARDAFGRKPFYYGINGKSFIFSSEIRSFFTDPSFPCKPNEGFVGEMLANAIASREETLYQHLFRLPPAHSMIVDANGIRKERYWDFDPKKKIRYQNDDQYAQHFLELFTEVLTQHMRSDRPIGADLSGGLDSSSIVCLAHSLFAKGKLPQNGFETFSLIFPNHKEADERTYIEDVIKMWNAKANLLAPAHDASIFAESTERSRYLSSPPNGHMEDSILFTAQEKGLRVMLTGLGGDEFLNGRLFYLADLLKQGRIFTLLKEAKSLQPNHLSIPFSLLRYGLFPIIKPIIPKHLLQVIQIIRGKNQSSSPFEGLTPEFIQRINLSKRLQNEARPSSFPTYTQNDTYQMMQDGWFPFLFEMVDRNDAQYKIEKRLPFYDRRMAEFCLALPGEQKMRCKKSKFILRQAMRGLLPESIRQRTDKGDFTFTFPQYFEDLEGRCLSDASMLAARGWVNSEQIQTMYQETIRLYHAGKGYPIWQLWMILALELWVRKVFSNKVEAISQETLQSQMAGA